MSKVYQRIEPKLRSFIERQPMFFVATAPLAADGHVNLSPRGVDGTSCVVDEHCFAWLDLSGSGAETIAHLRENGRITVMWCAFDGPPTIVRLHGTGRVVTRYDPDYAEWSARFPDQPGARAVIVVDVERVSDSCGWSVPLMDHLGERDLLTPYFARKGFDGSADYRRQKNSVSIDGLPAYDFDVPSVDWQSLEGLGRIRARLAAQLDGWSAPVAWTVADGQRPTVINRPGGRHGLASVALASVLKHNGSTATIPVSRQQLSWAATLLSPAEACPGVEHPNLAAWRKLLGSDNDDYSAVFVAELTDAVSSDADAALRDALVSDSMAQLDHRDGAGISDVAPERQRPVGVDNIVSARRRIPAVDPAELRRDIDDALNSSL